MTNYLADKILQKEITDKGNFVFPEYTQTIEMYILPPDQKLTEKWGISLFSDNKTISFRSESVNILEQVIEHMFLLYYYMVYGQQETTENFVNHTSKFLDSIKNKRGAWVEKLRTKKRWNNETNQ